MAIVGLEKIVFGVDDMATATRFWTDFGLSPVAEEPGLAVFATAEKTTVEVRPHDDASLPKGLAAGNTAREIVWGVESPADLDAIAAELSKDRAVVPGEDGTIRSTDHLGYAIGFRVTGREPVVCEPTEYNVPGNPGRVNGRGKIYDRATPQQMSHVVLLSPDLDGQVAFYRDRLGFRVTDFYAGRGYFLRVPGSHEHHNLFLLKGGDNIGFHHLAFEVRDIHEVFGGGLHMAEKGWTTHLGPGRHPISSCYFWYFRNPCGGAAEYDSDSDYVTEDWQPREWESTPENFAEWAYAEGATRYSGIQTGKL
ncbi:MAG: glyoxalase [Alphaproteobacteria bacterium]|nr:glyoxalase [Alphaproteobacteria bacterium]